MKKKKTSSIAYIGGIFVILIGLTMAFVLTSQYQDDYLSMPKEPLIDTTYEEILIVKEITESYNAIVKALDNLTLRLDQLENEQETLPEDE